MTSVDERFDLVGIGIGPFNLSLAALGDRLPGFRSVFFERGPEFRWHPGLMIEGATIQVPFLADLVSLVEPAHPLSFLSYLREHDRLFPFYFAERWHIDRAEYDDYCRWASRRLPSCRFGHDVHSVRWLPDERVFEVRYVTANHSGHVWARDVVLGIGTEPAIPAPLRGLLGEPGRLVSHSADYLRWRDELVAAGEVVVVGSGQSGAEVFLDLLRARPPGRERLRWFTRAGAFAPMEYSKLGLEHFTPDYTRYFHGLAESVRGPLVEAQWQLHKAISEETIADIHDELYRHRVSGGWPDVTITPGVEVVAARAGDGGIELELRHTENHDNATVRADGVVLATGYTERSLDPVLGPLAEVMVRDSAGRPQIDRDYRLDLGRDISGSVFVQNAERHTHGVGAPDLGLGAWRAAVILNAAHGREVYRLPARTAFTSFGLSAGHPPADSARSELTGTTPGSAG